MDIAYQRDAGGYREWVNGCPSIIAKTEPAFHVEEKAGGGLVMYWHFKMVGTIKAR